MAFLLKRVTFSYCTDGARDNPSGRYGGRSSYIFAPTQLFEPCRCCAWLIFRKEHTVLFTPKRTCFSRFATYEEGSQGSYRRVAVFFKQWSPYTGERQPLSLLRQTAPLTQGSQRSNRGVIMVFQRTAPFMRERQPFRPQRRPAPLTQGSQRQHRSLLLVKERNLRKGRRENNREESNDGDTLF